jgi:TatD DNase family protein
MLKKVPLDRLMLETDSPYLAPVPFRGKVNTPGLLVLAAQALAIEKGVSLEEICEITTANTEKFYINNPR